MLVEGELYSIVQLDFYFAVVTLDLGSLSLGIVSTDNLADGFGNNA